MPCRWIYCVTCSESRRFSIDRSALAERDDPGRTHFCSDLRHLGPRAGQGVPGARACQLRLKKGVGWTGSNLMMSPFGPIWDTPFGTAGDFMIVPDPAVEVRVDFGDGSAIEHFFLGDICNTDGSAWECCPRDFLRRAVRQLEEVASLRLIAAFEQEFVYTGTSRPAGRRLRPRRLPPAGHFRREFHRGLAGGRGGPGHLSCRVRPAPIRGDGDAAAGVDGGRSRGDHPRDGAGRRTPAGAPRDLLAKARPRSRRQWRAHSYEPWRRGRPAGDPRGRRGDGSQQTGAAFLCRRPAPLAGDLRDHRALARLLPAPCAQRVGADRDRSGAAGPRRHLAHLPGLRRRDTG